MIKTPNTFAKLIPLHVVAIVIGASAMFCSVAHAADWTLLTADLQPQTVSLRALSSDGLHVVGADGKTDRTILLDQFVCIQRPATEPPATPDFTLILSNGDRLVGDPGPVNGERLAWLSPLLGKVPVSFSRLTAINRGLNVSLPDEPPKQDIASLANGDTVAGVFSGCADQKITIQVDNGPVVIPLDSVKRIFFAPTGTAAVTDAREWRVRLNDGSILTVADAVVDADQLKITLKGKAATVISLPMTHVLGIEQTNGPISWLSSHTPAENIQTPYFAGARIWPAKFDLAVDGLPLSANGRCYDHGIGVHAYSRLTFDLDPQWVAFRTQYAIDWQRDEPRKYADVTVRIKLDDKVVFEEKHVHEGVVFNQVLLELKGAKTITLECDYGDSGDTQAHLDWLQPALLRAVPSPTTGPSTQPISP
jgi:hypothetical protein